MGQNSSCCDSNAVRETLKENTLTAAVVDEPAGQEEAEALAGLESPIAAWKEKPDERTPASSSAAYAEETIEVCAQEPDPEVSPQPVVDTLEQRLEQVLCLCYRALAVEAFAAYQELERDALKNREANSGFLTRLREDPTMCHLRQANGRHHVGLARVVEPAWKAGESWVSIKLQDPIIGDKFSMEMRIRFAKGEERDPKGPAAQMVISIDARDFPMPLDKLICMMAEGDLFKKNWIQDCESLAGIPGGGKLLWTNFFYTSLSPKLLPFKVEDLFMRDFVVCQSGGPPVPNSRPGVSLVETPPPDSMTRFLNYEVPERRRAVVRVSGSTKVNHFMPALSDPENMSDIIASAQLGLPLYQWMVPLEMLKSFFADLFQQTLRSIRLNIIDHWDEMEYQQRLMASSVFYSQMSEIISRAKERKDKGG